MNEVSALGIPRKLMAVLVAHDDDRTLIREAWTSSRVTSDLRFVRDGQDLMDYLNHAGKYGNRVSDPRPAMILLDLNMPRKDGLEVLKEIKADPDLRRIPIVILTTSEADEDIYRTYDPGANSFITKPASFSKLVDLLRVLGKYWIEVADQPPPHTNHLDVQPYCDDSKRGN